MLIAHVTQAAEALIPGVFLSTFGIAFFGIFGVFLLFGPIAFILLVANAFGGRSRSHGDPSGLGIVVGLGLVFILSVAIGAAWQ